MNNKVTDKSWVVIKHTESGGREGAYSIWADYGTVWGSPSYEVIGYYPTYKEARQLVKAQPHKRKAPN
jgi:hypothetical protein